jgi:hypothetical protein
MRKKDFVFSDGTTVKVHVISSADLDTFEELSLEATQGNHADTALGTFARLYYPVLAACTDNPPSLEASFKAEPNDLDNWFLLACELNPEWLGKQKYTEETIKLNGKTITIKSRRPSVELRLATLQEQSKNDKPLDKPKDEEYRTNGYIGVAAASFGNVPSAYQAKHDLELEEFNLWHKTVRTVIPEWYGESTAPAEAEAKEVSKKNKSPAGS